MLRSRVVGCVVKLCARKMWKKATNFSRIVSFCDKNKGCTAKSLNRYFASHQNTSLNDKGSNDKWIIPSKHPDIIIPNISLPQFIFDVQEKTAKHTVMVNGETGQSFTNLEVRNVSLRLASALFRLGFGKGDTVAIVSPNCPEFCFSFLGIVTVGATVTTVSSSFTTEEIGWQLVNSNSTGVICHKDKLRLVKSACKGNANIRFIISIGPEEEGVLSLHKLIQDDGKGIPSNIQINPEEDVVVLPYSSGTTGLPKGVMLTHKNIVSNLLQFSHPDVLPFKLATDDYQEVFLGVLPFYHIYAMVCGMCLALFSGTKLVTLKEFNQRQFVNNITKYKATILQTVPPIITFLNNSELVTEEVLSTVQSVVCGAAPIGSSLIEGLFKKFNRPINFTEGYGMTEASPVTHLTEKGNYVFGSCGAAVPNTWTKVIDLSTGLPIGPGGGRGEICVKGPQVMKGYYNNEKATLETIKDGWLHTGDIAEIDLDGNIYILDRLKELIKVKGLQVAPAELEDLIRKHPAVEEVAVVGFPDEKSGEVPRAFVVVSEGKHTTEEEIKEFVKSRVAKYKRLHGGVFFLNEIPKSASGKILRKNLKTGSV